MTICTNCRSEVPRESSTYKSHGLCGKCHADPKIFEHRDLQNQNKWSEWKQRFGGKA